MVCKKYHPLTFSPTSVPQCCKILIGGPVTERQVVKTSYGCVHSSHDKPYLGILFGQFPWKPRPSHREGQHHSLVMVLLLVLFHPSANKQQLKTTTTTTHLHPLHTYHWPVLGTRNNRSRCCLCMHTKSLSCVWLWHHGLQPTRLHCPWDSPGKNMGVGCSAPLQGSFLTQGSNLRLLRLLHWQVGSLPLIPLACMHTAFKRL